VFSNLSLWSATTPSGSFANIPHEQTCGFPSMLPLAIRRAQYRQRILGDDISLPHRCRPYVLSNPSRCESILDTAREFQMAVFSLHPHLTAFVFTVSGRSRDPFHMLHTRSMDVDSGPRYQFLDVERPLRPCGCLRTLEITAKAWYELLPSLPVLLRVDSVRP
jgi:hypothetical protein